MAKKKAATKNGKIWLDDGIVASIRMQAIQVAAHLPEGSPGGHGMMGGGYPGTPGKSAEKVVADAEKIMAFVTKAA